MLPKNKEARHENGLKIETLPNRIRPQFHLKVWVRMRVEVWVRFRV
jgi:hypothetical protein